MLTVLIGLALLSSVTSASQIIVYNKCPFTIWPGILGPGNPANGGFKLDSGQSRTVDVPDRWTAGRIWARTGCDDKFNCETGFCKNQLECSGAGGVPPVSLAEFTLGAQGAGNQDFYDVSLVDGYNIPVFIEPIDGTFNSNGGQYDCKRAGGCFSDPNQSCPQNMAIKGKNGNTVGCKSACAAFNTDQYCCRGAFNNPNTCKPENWPNPNFYKMFKDACPAAYAYAYDDKTSTFTCRGKNSISPVYTVQFLMNTVVIGIVLLSTAASASQIIVYNKCPFTIWPGILGPGNPANGGFKLDSGQSRTVNVPDRWTAGRIWARTGCDAKFNCETGFCKNQLECSGAGGVPPVSLAEFTLGAQGAGNQDFYDVSLVDGYNIPVLIEPKAGTFNSNGGKYDCKRAGGCVKDPNQSCPQNMAIKGKNGRTVGCKSACAAFNTDQYCCRGAFNNPNTCKPENWPNPNFYKMFKDACPAAYAYAYDDKTSTFTCRGKNAISPVYTVQFC